MFKRYVLYLIRWQLSTPILAVVLAWLVGFNEWVAAAIANVIGANIFFWVDRYIFTAVPILAPQWEIKNDVSCSDCGAVAKGFRLIRTKNYDRSEDKCPEFRCETCSEKKLVELKSRGVSLE